MAARTVYMDYNASTPLHPAARAAMQSCASFANSASIHAAGREAGRIVTEARRTAAAFFNVEPGEIVFTSGGSESNATVFHALVCRGRAGGESGGRSGVPPQGSERPRGRIILSAIEHPSVREAAHALSNLGFTVRQVRVDAQGALDLDDFAEALKEPTLLVSVMAASSHFGTIQDIAAIARTAHAYGALFHTDAVQAAGKIPLDLSALDVDYAGISAHKLYGPKGVGILYVREGSPFAPLVPGADSERRAGTADTAGIVGMAAALEAAAAEMPAEEGRLRALSVALRRGIESSVSGACFHGHPSRRLANTLCVSFDGLEGEALALHLDAEGIAVSTGSACESLTGEPSQALLALGVSPAEARAAIRISMGRETTVEDVEYVLEKLPAVVERTRSL